MSHIHDVTFLSECEWISMQSADEFIAKKNGYLIKQECPNCDNKKVIVPIRLFTHDKTVSRTCYCHNCMTKFTFRITK